jgi:hypothetical protein
VLLGRLHSSLKVPSLIRLWSLSVIIARTDWNMKKTVLGIIVIVSLLVLGNGLYAYLNNTADSGVRDGLQEYSNATYGISFTYPATYILNETEAAGSAERTHHVITLMRKEDLPLPEAGEGPPSITIEVYQNNLDKQTTEDWIRNTSASNFKLGEGVLASTTISGLPALSYRWSGLYEGTTIVLARSSRVYVFSVTYLEMGAPIIQDFVAIRDSVRISE